MTAKIKRVSGGAAPAASASDQILKGSQKAISDTDSLGRTIVLRKPTTWEKFELPRVLGEDSINPGWQFQALMILHVKQIGDDTDVFFRSERELKAIVNQLGDEGMATVERLYIDHFMKNSSETVGDIKK